MEAVPRPLRYKDDSESSFLSLLTSTESTRLPPSAVHPGYLHIFRSSLIALDG